MLCRGWEDGQKDGRGAGMSEKSRRNSEMGETVRDMKGVKNDSEMGETDREMRGVKEEKKMRQEE